MDPPISKYTTFSTYNYLGFLSLWYAYLRSNRNLEMKKDVQEENVYTALLTAGVVLFMACLKHSPAVMSLIEQWRAWVFLLLNLVLIAIFYTSTRSVPDNNQDCKNHHAKKFKIKGKKRTKRVCSLFEEPEEYQEIKNQTSNFKIKGEVNMKRVSTELEDHGIRHVFDTKRSDDEREREPGNVFVDKEEDNEPSRLSNEELNERVEAFIAMFRQHLVLDARKGRETDTDIGREKIEPARRLAQVLNSHKGCYSNIIFSSHEVTCSV